MALQSAGKTYTKTAPNASYPDTGNAEMTNGVVSTRSGTSGEWLTDAAYFTGWYASPVADFFVRIDLTTAYALDYVRFNYGNWFAAGIKHPSTLVVSGSNDDSSYTTLGTFVQTTDWNSADGAVQWSNNLTVAGTYRYVKFVFTPILEWVFLDEIEVYGSAAAAGAKMLASLGVGK